MQGKDFRRGRARSWGGTFVLGVAFLAGMLLVDYMRQPAHSQRPADSAAATEFTPRPIDVLAPGTVVDELPTAEWSHLIIKKRSRIRAGDVDQVSSTVKHLASFLFSALVANVKADAKAGPARYRLSDIAHGIGVRIGDKDMIISSATQRSLGANLGMLERLALSRAEARFPSLVVVARTDTMAIIDGRTQILRDDEHHDAILRHAVLVDAATGHVETLLWYINLNDKGDYTEVASPFDRLRPNTIRELALHVDANEFTLGQITEKALATILPDARDPRLIAIPENLKAACAQRGDAAALEAHLRTVLRHAGAR